MTPRSYVHTIGAETKRPIQATEQVLLRTLRDSPSRPILWIGERLSVAAGYPSSAELAARIRQASFEPINEALELPEVIDHFVQRDFGIDRRNRLHAPDARVF